MAEKCPETTVKLVKIYPFWSRKRDSRALKTLWEPAPTPVYRQEPTIPSRRAKGTSENHKITKKARNGSNGGQDGGNVLAGRPLRWYEPSGTQEHAEQLEPDHSLSPSPAIGRDSARKGGVGIPWLRARTSQCAARTSPRPQLREEALKIQAVTPWDARNQQVCGFWNAKTLSKLALKYGLMKWCNYLIPCWPECGRSLNVVVAPITDKLCQLCQDPYSPRP